MTVFQNLSNLFPQTQFTQIRNLKEDKKLSINLNLTLMFSLKKCELQSSGLKRFKDREAKSYKTIDPAVQRLASESSMRSAQMTPMRPQSKQEPTRRASLMSGVA